MFSGNMQTLSGLGYSYAVENKKRKAQKVLVQLNEISNQKYSPAVYMARMYAGLSEKDKAFEWWEKDYNQLVCIWTPNGSRSYDPLSDPRFAALLRRKNLQP